MHKLQLRSNCPVNFLVETFGDKWSLLILRDIVFWGKRTHGAFLRSEEGIATNILADRLCKLEGANILTRTADPHDKRREIYALTEKGLGLIPLLLDAIVWSAAFGPDYLSLSKTLVTDLEQDRERVLATITEEVRNGGSVFAYERWSREHSGSMQYGGHSAGHP